MTMKTFAVLFATIFLAKTISGLAPDCADKETGVFVQDLDECDKFYQCVHGTAIRFNCPDGLHFNIESNRCDYQSNVRCEKLITPADLCRERETGQLLSDPYDCNAFIQCTNDRIGYDLHKCESGLVFNPLINVCDHANNYACTPLA